MKATSKKISAIIFAVIFFLFDRLIKLVFISYYSHLEFRLIGDWLKLKLAFNPGIAFSLPLNSWLIIISTLIIMIILILVAINSYRQENWMMFGSWSILIAGAASNFADRLHYGLVVDYLDLKYFTVFNLADIAIILAIVYLLFNLTISRISRKT